MKSSRLSPARIARSVVTVLVLTLIQTVGSPLINLATPQASASTLYGNSSNFQQWETWRTSANHPVYDAETTNQITSNDQAFELTPNSGSKAGFIWNTQTVSLSRDFSLSAWYYLGASDAGADGIVFSMRPLVDWPNDGMAGGNNGDWSHWSSNELKVILDTYPNGSEITQDHIRIVASKNGVDTNYSGSGVKFKDGSGNIIDDVENNAWYSLTFRWTASTRLMSVYSGLNANYLITSATVPASDFTLTEYNWGWMGYTGGASNVQQITTVNYQVGPTVSTSNTNTTVVDGTSVTLSATYSSSEASPTTRWEYSTDGGTTWNSTGTTTTSYTFTATRSLTQRKYRFYVEATAGGSTLSKATEPITLTVNPLPLGSETDTSVNSTSQRFFYAPNADSILPGTISTLTMEAWVKPSTSCDASYYCSIIASNNSVFFGVYQGKLAYIIGSGSAWCSSGAVNYVSRGLVPSGSWTHVAMVRNASNVKIYVNGSLVSDLNSSCSPTSMTAPSTQQFGIGYRHTQDQYFYGSIDEVRIWTSDRSASLSSDMNSNETSTANLIGYWNFNEGSGGTAFNQVPTALSSSDLISYGTDKGNAAFWDDASISSVSSSGPYTVRTFYRSYITAKGGWKVSPGVSKVSTLIVGGGGGGGGTGSRGWSGGGGGGGRVVQQSPVNLTPGFTVPVLIGQGGNGGSDLAQAEASDFAQNGGSSTFSNLVAQGGGPGGHAVQGTFTSSPYSSTDPAAPKNGGGGGAQSYYFAGAQTDDGIYRGGNGFGSGSTDQSAGGGAGSSGNGGNGVSNVGGNGGAGTSSAISGATVTYGGGGGGGKRHNAGSAGSGVDGGGNGGFVAAGGAGATNRGGGGGGAGGTALLGGYGGSGVVIIRWITATVPTYTKPTNAYLNIGMTETFTTNVSQDSSTVTLTRTFKWESTTPAANGSYSLIKQGTGASNAAFSWIPTDTSTSGSGYLYRLTVTDSDTSGLFITDSSTAYAIINRALVVTGSSIIPKAINISKSETFTITLGTSTYRPSLSPVIPGISLDTSTAGYAVLMISDTMTVGTYYETLTVIDSVSASVTVPLIIKVQAPPNLLSSAEIRQDNLVFNIDAGNTASYRPGVNSVKDISGRNRTVTINGTGTLEYSSANLGTLKLKSTSGQYLSAVNVPAMNTWTIDAYIRLDAAVGADGGCIVAPDYTSLSSELNYELCFDTAGTVYTGYRKTGGWFYARTTDAISTDVWKHIVGTYDGTNMTVYFDGVNKARNTANDSGTTTPPVSTLSNMYIGRSFDTTKGTFLSASIGYIRIYNTGFTDAQVVESYNASKFRFSSSAINYLSPSKKYGTSLLETLTVTSGSETKTVSFNVGDRVGIDWDTTTVTNQVKLLMQETLSAGTYNDTVTVTDSLGQSSYLPIKMTVTKADTLTVTVRNPATNVYTGNTPATLPTLGITGLVTTDTGTVVPSYKGTTTWGSTCATGGTCTVGETGPGGGRVFKVSGTVIDSATGISSGGIYLELAPIAWNGDPNESAMAWSTDYSNISGTVVTTGSGAENNSKILAAIGSAATAVSTVVNSTFGNQNDWFLPSTAELQEALTASTGWTYGGLVAGRNYWTSTQDTTEGTTTQANTVWSSTGGIDAVPKGPTPYYVRPIRAFSPVYQSSLAPTEVETYTVSAKLNLSSGSLSNYINVVYETSTLKITQANQNKLTINLYGAVAGSPFTIQVSGGSGTGAVTETITSGSTAINCRFTSYHVLANDTPSNDQKSCNISLTKAASRNYFSESMTATVYFMTFANSQPTSQVGGGTVIALNGATYLETSTVTPPTITGFSTLTFSISSGGTLRITGTDLGGAITIKFYRNKLVTIANNPNTGFVDVPALSISTAGATTGRVAVITAAGEAVSEQTLVITP